MRYSWRAPSSKVISGTLDAVFRFLVGGGSMLFLGLGFANMTQRDFVKESGVEVSDANERGSEHLEVVVEVIYGLCLFQRIFVSWLH